MRNVFRILLDDVLAAVDAHVARHLFGLFDGIHLVIYREVNEYL